MVGKGGTDRKRCTRLSSCADPRDEGMDEDGGGVRVLQEVLGDLFFFEAPHSHALKCGVTGTCRVTSLCVLSLGGDYRLVFGRVASSQPYLPQMLEWMSTLCLYKFNTLHVH